jgi:hypothetical protein
VNETRDNFGMGARSQSYQAQPAVPFPTLGSRCSVRTLEAAHRQPAFGYRLAHLPTDLAPTRPPTLEPAPPITARTHVTPPATSPCTAADS